MVDFVKLNGTPVRATGLYRRTVAQPAGAPREEVNLVVILRGRMDNRAFLALLEPGQVRLEFPGGEAFEATVAAASHASSGSSEAAAYRHDVTLHETAASAERRAAARATAAEEVGAAGTAQTTDAGDQADDADAPLDLGPVGASAATWATALRQLTAPRAETPAEPSPPAEEPLAPAELAGVEAVLVGLRLEALIETLDRSGAIRRSAVDDAFLRLIGERFVAEATPVVGEAVAQRVVKDLLET